MPDRLYRSRADRMIGGVAGGMAAALRMDPSLVRVGWVILALATSGAAIFVYFVMLFVVPEEPAGLGAASPAGHGEDSSTEPTAARSSTYGAPPVDDGGDDLAAPRAASSTNGPLLLGLLLILVGAWFLLRPFIPQIDWQLTWPVLAVGVGVVLVAMALRPGRRGAR
jgi:phage shock protein PspC (stress-responsive transcriptional regulator)